MAQLLKFLGLNSGIIKNINSLSFSFANTFAAFTLVLLVMLPLTLYFCRFEGKPINKKTKNILLAIRICWVIIISALAAGPVLIITGMVPEKSKIAVLIDTSKSMGIKNKLSDGNEISRLDEMKSLLKNGFLEKIEEKILAVPDVFMFSDTIKQTSSRELNDLSFEAEGNQTNLSEAVKNVVGNLGGSSLLGVIVLSDGVHTIGGSLLNEAGNMKTPIHFVTPDFESEKTDFAISLNNPPSTAYLNSGVRIKGEVSVFGAVAAPIKIDVTCNDMPYGSLVASIKNGERRGEFALNIPCNREGIYKYDFKIPTGQNELTGDNNSASFLLKVVKERLNILAISGSPSWELKFMGNAAMSDPNAHFTYVSKLFDDKWAVSVDMKPSPATNNPGLVKAVENADVIILNGVNYKDLRVAETDIISKVESGKAGLLVMASDKTFVQLGYKGSEIAKLLPVNIEKEKETSNTGSFSIVSERPEYAFLRIIDDNYQNKNFFSSLPKPESISDFGELNIGAESLLGVSASGKASLTPFMVKSRYGRGNIIMIMGGPLWFSGFKLVPTDYGFTPYSAFVVNMLKMLANRHEDAQVSLELPTAKNVTGSPTTIRIWVSDSKRQLLANAQPVLSVYKVESEKTDIPCIETSEKGCYEATFVPSDKGIWKIDAEASYRGRLLGKTNGELLVETPTAEFDNPAINFETMQKTSEITGGICVSAKDADKVVSCLTNVTDEKLVSKAIDLRDSWLLLLIILLLPAIEWYLRRTGGLS